MSTLEEILENIKKAKHEIVFDAPKFKEILNIDSNFQGMIGEQSKHFAFLKKQFAKIGSFGKTMPQLTQTEEIKDGTYTFENDDAAEQFKKQ